MNYVRLRIDKLSKSVYYDNDPNLIALPLALTR